MLRRSLMPESVYLFFFNKREILVVAFYNST